MRAIKLITTHNPSPTKKVPIKHQEVFKVNLDDSNLVTTSVNTTRKDSDISTGRKPKVDKYPTLAKGRSRQVDMNVSKSVPFMSPMQNYGRRQQSQES